MGRIGWKRTRTASYRFRKISCPSLTTVSLSDHIVKDGTFQVHGEQVSRDGGRHGGGDPLRIREGKLTILVCVGGILLIRLRRTGDIEISHCQPAEVEIFKRVFRRS